MKLEELSAPTPLESIDWRVQSISKKGYCTILGYKDARYDMNVLDRVVGPENWQKQFQTIGGKLYCGVSVLCDGQWVTKWDVGTESNTEAVKGQASDAFKRACFNWGIGRDLYDLPRILCKLKDNEWNKQTGKPTFDFCLPEWTWERDGSGKIVGKDEGGETRFVEGVKFNTPRGDAGKQPPASNTEHVGKDPAIPSERVGEIISLAKKAKITQGQMKNKIGGLKSGKTKIEELNAAEAAIIIAALEQKIGS